MDCYWKTILPNFIKRETTKSRNRGNGPVACEIAFENWADVERKA
jgi:hypothetical protein